MTDTDGEAAHHAASPSTIGFISARSTIKRETPQKGKLHNPFPHPTQTLTAVTQRLNTLNLIK